MTSKPKQIDKGHFNITIAKDGAWYHEGGKIERLPLVKLFASVLKKEDDRYVLETPVEKGEITVEDAPFVVVAMTREGTGKDQTLTFQTNLDEKVSAGEAHDIRVAFDAVSGEPRPYVHVRGGLEARIERSVFYDLIALAEPAPDQSGRHGVWSKGKFYKLEP